MIPIIVGYAITGHCIGWRADACSFCGSVQAHQCFDAEISHELYGFSAGGPRPYSLRTVCSFCGEVADYDPEAALSVDEIWTPECDIKQLVQSTNPGVALEVHAEVADSQAAAVIRRCDGWAFEYFFHHSNMGWAVGALSFVSILGGMYLGSLVSPAVASQTSGAVHDSTLILGLPTGLLGAYLGYRLVRLIYLSRLLRDRLTIVMNHYSIPKAQFLRALTSVGRPNDYVRRAVRTLPPKGHPN